MGMFQYVVRVREKVYIWGSADFSAALTETLFLHINNDRLGDQVTVASESGPGAPTPLGTLRPGECWTLSLNGLRGVTATCASDTTLACAVDSSGQ